MAADIEAARLLVYHAAWLVDRGRPATQATSSAKLFATEAAAMAASEAVSLYGNRGYSNEYPVERYYRDIKGLQIYEGTSHIQRIIIARELIGRERVVSQEQCRFTAQVRRVRRWRIPNTGIRRTRRCRARSCSALQLVKLQRMCPVGICAQPLPQQPLRRGGVHPDQLKTLDDLRRIPFMTREEWMESQAEQPLFGDLPTTDPGSRHPLPPDLRHQRTRRRSACSTA